MDERQCGNTTPARVTQCRHTDRMTAERIAAPAPRPAQSRCPNVLLKHLLNDRFGGGTTRRSGQLRADILDDVAQVPAHCAVRVEGEIDRPSTNLNLRNTERCRLFWGQRERT